MNLKEAANVAWHVRVNGQGPELTPTMIKDAFAVLEQLIEREPLVQAVVKAFEREPAPKLSELYDALNAVRDFKVST